MVALRGFLTKGLCRKTDDIRSYLFLLYWIPRFGVIVVYADRVLLLWLGNTPWRSIGGICRFSTWHIRRDFRDFFRSKIKAPSSNLYWSGEHRPNIAKEQIRPGDHPQWIKSTIVRDARTVRRGMRVNVFPPLIHVVSPMSFIDAPVLDIRSVILFQFRASL